MTALINSVNAAVTASTNTAEQRMNTIKEELKAEMVTKADIAELKLEMATKAEITELRDLLLNLNSMADRHGASDAGGRSLGRNDRAALAGTVTEV